MRKRLERDSLSFITGPSYMEEDVRTETNRLGFCERHLNVLYGENNRLGFALMLHTYFKKLNKDADDIIGNKFLGIPLPKAKKGNEAARLADRLKAAAGTCYLCKRVGDTFERYVDTFFYLWETESKVRELFDAAPGLCLPHFALLLGRSESALGGERRQRFLSALVQKQQACLRELESDLEWFTLKFDYRNADAPWKNSRDALSRAIETLTSNSPAGD